MAGQPRALNGAPARWHPACFRGGEDNLEEIFSVRNKCTSNMNYRRKEKINNSRIPALARAPVRARASERRLCTLKSQG